ncbi:MAG TPA: hypothetical protein VEK55_12565 [Xanthobacteraceae bacterium]|nr:hypothetical protein [Xanthobacteraceae bacterium]
MSNDSVTAELTAWQDRLAVVSRNLADINQLPALLAIKARLRRRPDTYVGETATRLGDALAALDELWKDYLLLNALLDQAEGLRRQGSLFRTHDAEIEALLHGRSIALPPAHVPLAERGLLTKSERAEKATPEELLAAMEAIFNIAKSTILTLDGAEAQLRPRLQALDAEARALVDRAGALGLGKGEIAAIAARVEALGVESAADPLAAVRKLTEAGAALDAWRARIGGLEREHEALAAAFQNASKTLDELKSLNQQAREAHSACLAKVRGLSGLPAPAAEPVIAQFGTWLDTLEAKRSSGDWATAKASLDKWLAACATHQTEERRVLAASTAQLAARDELRGRLKALRAKAMALAQRGQGVDPATTRLGDEAEDTLYRRPADLAKATTLLSAYEAAITRGGLR